MKRIKGFLLSLGVATGAGGIFLGVSALVISKTGNLPHGSVLGLVVTLSACLAVFLGGLSASLFTKEKGVLLGGACGLFFVCFIALISLAFSEVQFTVSGGTRLAAIFLSGCIGGILGVNRKGKVKF